MRTSLILAVMVTLTIGGLSNARAQTNSQTPGTSVAVIDISYVFDKHERFKRMMDEVKRDIERFDAKFQEQRKQLAKRAEGLQELKSSSVEYKQLEAEIAKANADLSVQMQLKRKDILMSEAEIYYNAYNEVYEHVAKFADRNGIGLVLRFDGKTIDPTQRDSVLKGVNRGVVFQRRLNISDLIVSRLNAGVAPRDLSRKPAIPARR